MTGADGELQSLMVTKCFRFRLEPGKSCVTEAKVVRQAAEEDSVGYGIEGCREVQEDENADEAGIRSDEEVVCDFNEGRLCAVVGFTELIVGHVVLELCGNCPFQDCAEERKV